MKVSQNLPLRCETCLASMVKQLPRICWFWWHYWMYEKVQNRQVFECVHSVMMTRLVKGWSTERLFQNTLPRTRLWTDVHKCLVFISITHYRQWKIWEITLLKGTTFMVCVVWLVICQRMKIYSTSSMVRT